jgi:hypothetical protein
MNVSKLAIALIVLTLTWAIDLAKTSAAEERCHETREYTLCFDNDWLQYYNQLDLDFDWRNYVREEDAPEAADYYNDIQLIYREVLGREATVEELATRSQQVAEGMPLSQIRTQLADSIEARDAINRIYQQILGRNADLSGLQTWTNKLARGGTLVEVEAAIAASEEAAKRTGGR